MACGYFLRYVTVKLPVNWNKDGIQYDLLQIDGKLSADELADMAREVINNRR